MEYQHIKYEAMDAAAEAHAAADAIHEYEAECLELVATVNNSLRWTIGWLIATLAFNLVLMYCNLRAGDRFRKLNQELTILRQEVVRRQRDIAKSVRFLVRLAARVEDERLDERLDQVIDRYSGGLVTSTTSTSRCESVVSEVPTDADTALLIPPASGDVQHARRDYVDGAEGPSNVTRAKMVKSVESATAPFTTEDNEDAKVAFVRLHEGPDEKQQSGDLKARMAAVRDNLGLTAVFKKKPP